MNDIKERLMIVRHDQPGKPTFSMSSNKERQEQMAQVTSSMTSFLTAIAAVALLVGAVGVANTMFTSVLERTKEIGVMKAVGARNGDIMMIFLLNACIIGLIGGILGIALGYLFSGLLPTLMGSSGGILGRFGAGSVITMQSVMLALGISLGIGTISGIIPAYKASKLKPVDALRYE
jgi:putative ABC transport system permease protein